MIAIYMDESVHGAITTGLRERGIDVLRAQDDGRDGYSDEVILTRATELDRVLFAQDDDFLGIAADMQRRGMPFSGVIYAHKLTVSIGQCIEDLSLLAQAGKPDDFAGHVYFLPL